MVVLNGCTALNCPANGFRKSLYIKVFGILMMTLIKIVQYGTVTLLANGLWYRHRVPEIAEGRRIPHMLAQLRRYTMLPATMVAVTAPRKVRPSKGVLRLFERPSAAW